jgi:TonB family protein
MEEIIMGEQSFLILFFLVFVLGCSSKFVPLMNEPDDGKLPALLVVGDTTCSSYAKKDSSIASVDSVLYDALPTVIKQYWPESLLHRLSIGDGVDVFVKAWVTKEGTVKQAVVYKSTNNKFNKVAGEAALKWVFKPAILNGEPVSVWIGIPFRFREK